MKKSALSAFLIVTAMPAAAQDADWTYKATLYGWFPGMSVTMDTDFGTIQSETSGSDALAALDMAFMGTFAAQNGRLGFVGDLLYTDLSNTEDTPGAAFGSVGVAVKLTALSGYVLYRVSSDPKVQFDVGGGFRNFDIEADANLTDGLLSGGSRSLDTNWTDPLIAARLSVPLDDKWFLMGFADFGGTSADDQTWQVYGGVGYAFDDRWSTQLGYRYMDISKEVNGKDLSIGLSGPTIALSYSF
jgi:opacity protein-like surface antigen